MQDEIPEYNLTQLKILINGLECLDTSNYHIGYKETHKHLLEKYKKLIKEN